MKDLTNIEEIILLSIFKLKDQAYGYKIRRHIKAALKKDITYGHLYSALSQLAKKKYVTKRTGETAPSRRGKERVYYSLAPAGREALLFAFDKNQRLWEGVSRYALETKGE